MPFGLCSMNSLNNLVCQMKHRVAGNHTCYNLINWPQQSAALIWPCYYLSSFLLHIHLLLDTNFNTKIRTVLMRSPVQRCSITLLLLLLIPASWLPEAHNAARWLNVIVFSSESPLLLNHGFLKVLSRKYNKDSLVILRSSVKSTLETVWQMPT